MASVDEILVGANGDVFVAAPATTAPTSPTASYGAGWTKLGLISETGVTVTDTKTMVVIPAWQLFYPARRIITERALTVAFALREWSGTGLKFAFGGGTISAGKFTPPAPDFIDQRMLGVDWADEGKVFELPAVYPLEAAFAIERDDAEAYLRSMLGEQFEAFMALKPDRDDLYALVEAMGREYGPDQGESSASSRSSARNGSRSRPTSNGSTGS